MSAPPAINIISSLLNEFKADIPLVGLVLAESLYHLTPLISRTNSNLWDTPEKFFIVSTALSISTNDSVNANAVQTFWKLCIPLVSNLLY